MPKPERFTNAAGSPVSDNTNIMTAGRRGPALLQDIWLIEKRAHFDREVIPERRMHAKGWGGYGTFTTTHDITKYTKAAMFSKVGKQTPMFARFSTVAGERGAADAERDIRGFALKFYTEDGNWDIVGNNTPVFFFRDPLRFSDLNHAIKRDADLPLALEGDANHYDHRLEDDHWEQPGNLFRKMSSEQKQLLFDNTARAINGASQEVLERHVANCRRADPAYGDGVARALKAECFNGRITCHYSESM